jgi:hypothetical protein
VGTKARRLASEVRHWQGPQRHDGLEDKDDAPPDHGFSLSPREVQVIPAQRGIIASCGSIRGACAWAALTTDP